MQGLREAVQGHPAGSQVLPGLPKAKVLGPPVREKAVTPDPLLPIKKIVAQYGLDDVDALIIAYRTGAKGVATFAQISSYLTQAGRTVSRQRVQQLQKSIIEKIGKDNWERLKGIYVANRPLASSKSALRKSIAALRVRLRNFPANKTLQYGQIMDELEIPFKHDDEDEDPYGLDELQSARKFYELYGIRHFGKFKHCVRCDQIKVVSPDPELSEFYPVGGKDRHYSTCKPCNTDRCRDYTAKKRA